MTKQLKDELIIAFSESGVTKAYQLMGSNKISTAKLYRYMNKREFTKAFTEL